MINKLPEYICTKCADKNGADKTRYGFTLHENICPLCNEKGMLATLADFGIEKETNENWD